MNILIKHNSTNITSRVIAYSREHQICSSIGRLQLTLEGTYATSIEPHDSVDIYENGDFKVRYYVSQVSKNVPDNTIILECQDKSKYIVDYFIPDTYTIDYPSYTRYWIEKFLTEAGISYSFTTSSQGKLISNNTALGLQPAYDQIMMLLQLSGWFMYFDGNGVAVIGTLDTDLATSAGSIDNSDILDIKRITDDKMLRNRAVVWGQFDAIRQEYAYADVTKHTPWNYDHNDLRSMVISNSNIPNKSSAYNIANILLKEFARVTIEKHITVHGARNYNLGEALRVNSRIWRGKGLITTFGVSMDRNGLVTNIILDERCPRLFGFFNFGDYVYVGTFGDGVWRKHIKFDPTWYNFSTGLTDLNITDLHINNGIFGAVGHSGAAYYANSEEGSWSQVTITGLESSVDDNVPSGQMPTYTMFSGLVARATVVDKELNTVKFGIDTWSGLNTGDYFLASGITASGVFESGNMRGWIVEYDPYTGNPMGGLGSGIYPIVYSGNYSMRVLDLENDGANDYVSVASTGESIPNNGTYWNFGQRMNQPFASTRDYDTYSVAPSDATYVNNSESINIGTVNTFNKSSLVAKDDALNGVRMVGVFGKDLRFREIVITQNPDGTFTTTTTTSSISTNITTNHRVLGIYADWFLREYTIFYRDNPNTSGHTFYYIKWSASPASWGSPVTLATQNLLTPLTIDASFSDDVVINNKCYNLRYYVMAPNTSGGFRLSPSYLYVYLDTIDIELKTFTEQILIEFITEDDDLDGRYDHFPGVSVSTDEALGTFNRTIFGIFQKNEGIQILGWTTVRRQSTPVRFREYIFVGDQNVMQSEMIYESSTVRFENGNSNLWSQLSLDKAFIGRQSSVAGQGTFSFNGTTFSTETSDGTLPRYKDPSKITPVLNSEGRYIIEDGGLFYLGNADTISEIAEISSPAGYALSQPFSTPTKFVQDEIYFGAYELPSFNGVYIPYNLEDFNLTAILRPDNVLLSNYRAINFGGFFIAEPPDYTIGTPVTHIHYVDMGVPFYGGGSYMVLQREGLDYNLIQQAAKPIRVDISNNSPILTVQDNENTFQSNFVYENELTQVIPVSGLQSTQVRDYRYTLLETVSGVIVGSGAGVGMLAVYVTGSGIYTSDVNTYSGGFVLFDSSPSGLLERIETSNYTYPGQFLFVTTSGSNPIFYQKDNDSLVFDTYSGLPDSRVTIVRCDDRF